MTEIRHIVFDIGKVLIHYDPHLAVADIIPDEDERNWFFANVCTSDWNIEQDRGRSWEEAEALLTAEHPERADQIRAFRQNWHTPLAMVPTRNQRSYTLRWQPTIRAGHLSISSFPGVRCRILRRESLGPNDSTDLPQPNEVLPVLIPSLLIASIRPCCQESR